MPIIFHQDNVVLYKELAISSSIKERDNIVQLIANRLFNTDISHKPSGAPYLVDNAEFRHISISHTDSYLALYYSAVEPCGVDIELVMRNASKVSRKFTNEIEVEIVNSVFPKNPELLVWCTKEALYKMCGIEGAEFKTDFLVTAISEGTIQCTAFGQQVICSYFEFDNLLIVKTLCRN